MFQFWMVECHSNEEWFHVKMDHPYHSKTDQNGGHFESYVGPFLNGWEFGTGTDHSKWNIQNRNFKNFQSSSLFSIQACGFRVPTKLMRIELSNRECPFIRLFVRARIPMNIVIVRYIERFSCRKY